MSVDPDQPSERATAKVPRKELQKEPHADALKVLNVIEKITIEQCDRKDRQWVVRFVLRIYAFTVLATFAIILLQGFHIGGFMLQPEFLKWLGIATIGQIGGLLTIILHYLFRKR